MSPAHLFIFGSVLVLLFALTAYRASSILAPAPLWNAAWAVLFLATGALGADFIYSTNAVMILFLAVLTFNVGAVLVDSAPRDGERRDDTMPRRIPSWILLACVGVGLLGAVELSRSFGTALLELRSLGELFSAGQQNAVLIFRGEAELTQLQKASFALLQAGSVLAGAKVRLERSRTAVMWCGAFLLTAMLWSSITTQRSYLLILAVWAVAGYVAAAVRQGTFVLPPKTLLRAGASVAVLALLVVYFRAVRVSGDGASLSGDTFASARLWVAGYIPTFSAWYDNGGSNAGEVSPGLLGGVYALFGAGTEGGDDSGGYEYIGAGLSSNAATMMRSVFSTAGVFAAFVSMATYGIVAQAVYRRALAGRTVAAAMYAGVVASILWSTNAWFFNYGGRLLALAAVVTFAVAVRTLRADEAVTVRPGTRAFTVGVPVQSIAPMHHRRRPGPRKPSRAAGSSARSSAS
ncbi:hypothetical protein [Cellulomonas shaoxiangyii]|uniref:Oligosaccharide repeat unit polymerase n=1 Tax=Cellulomonas shaoxiangyii TaxID=2566013 RepID=A0A4P7SK57_9CELL|nr:hypothetical protein [Cellulomonas shaoxiangyii]QCB94540.1 hypothetical protein E5225_14235 [Cellulomonas shaoxiangyii]TGY82326.1 hypothetical protein E5226_13305 [Cellulomonas shaoxiangyii]